METIRRLGISGALLGAIFCLPVSTTFKVLLFLLSLLLLYKDLIFILLATLPRDVTAVYKLLSLVFYTKRAEMQNLTVPKMFERSVKKFPSKVLFRYEDQEWTFKQVDEESNRIGHFFLHQGLKSGESVGVFMTNTPQFVATWLGLAKVGLIPALINNNLRQESLTHSIKVANCKALVFSSQFQEAVAQITNIFNLGNEESALQLFVTGGKSSDNSSLLECVDLDEGVREESCEPIPQLIQDSINFKDKLMYIYTSGTTGLPKAAVIKHARYILAGGGLTIMIGVRPSDVVYCPLPLYHSVGGMISLSGCMANGITMVIREKFSPSNYWKDCVRHNVTVCQYIGEICRYLLGSPECEEESRHSVRLMFGNGLRPDIWEDFVERFSIPNISEFYGSTEGNSNILNYDNTVGAVGFVPVLFASILPLGPIKVDESGEAVKDPETGLCIRCKPGEPGEFVGVIQQNHPVREFAGYLDAESTQKKVISDVWKKGDMCFRSGDILVSDKYGYLYFKDRKGDTFRWKGENVSTAEVESVVSGCLGLTDVVVYGVAVPGAEGRAGMAAIVHQGPKPVDLIILAEKMQAKLPIYARPIFLRLVSELDMTGTFKLKKRSLQMEGFNPGEVSDRLFFLDTKTNKYTKLSDEVYLKISGEIRI